MSLAISNSKIPVIPLLLSHGLKSKAEMTLVSFYMSLNILKNCCGLTPVDIGVDKALLHKQF
jgi:hypothetical protein